MLLLLMSVPGRADPATAPPPSTRRPGRAISWLSREPPMSATTLARPARPGPVHPGEAAAAADRAPSSGVVSDYQPSGDQANRHRRAGYRCADRRARPGAAGRHRVEQDLHHGQDDRAVQRHSLILAPNKTLAAQLYGENEGILPRQRGGCFVSYYELRTTSRRAYVPRTDTYPIEKDAQINEQIDRMRPSPPQKLLGTQRRHHRRLGLLPIY